MTPPTDTPTAPLLPDPDRLRARLAELAREQAILRKVLRAVVRGQCLPSPATPDPDRIHAPKPQEEAQPCGA